MRWVYLALLLAILASFVVFAFLNNEPTSVNFFGRSLTAPLSWFFVAVYFLGMFTGGTVVGFVRRALQKATEHKGQ